MDNSTEIYLVRHGQSVHNQKDRIAGQLGSKLTGQGVEDARCIAAAIGRRDLDVIYSSDLRRARQTAETIADALKLNCPIILTPLLRELNYGKYTGRPVGEAFRFLNYKVLQDQRYPGGESFQDLEKRVTQFKQQLLCESQGKRILVTAHAGSIRILAMLFDPAHRREYLAQLFGNRFLGKVLLRTDGTLVSYTQLADAGCQLANVP